MSAPGPHWLHHAVIALVLMLCVGLVAGVMFYAGREVRDREKLGTWDWPGLIAPVVACVAVWCAWHAWRWLQ